jgi:hypothetical protein
MAAFPVSLCYRISIIQWFVLIENFLGRDEERQTYPVYFDIMASLKEVGMQKGTRIALILGAIPFIMMVFALPLVNRIEPIILGLPFLLFWLLAWVVMTPFILMAAYVLEKKFNAPEEGEEE